MMSIEIEILREALERSIEKFIQSSNFRNDLIMQAKLKEECKRFIDQILQILSPAKAKGSRSPILRVSVTRIKDEQLRTIRHEHEEKSILGLEWNLSAPIEDCMEIEMKPALPTPVTQPPVSQANDFDNEIGQLPFKSSMNNDRPGVPGEDGNQSLPPEKPLEQRKGSKKKASNKRAKRKRPSSRKPDKRKRIRRNRIRRKDKPYLCDECPKRFQRPSELTEHKNLHLNPNIYQCHLCPSALISRTSLRLHILRMHTLEKSERTYACEICGKEYLSKSFLKVHHNVRHNDGKKEFICEICGKAEPHSMYLQRHVKLCHSAPVEKTFECELCGKKFAIKAQLTTHMPFHSEEKTFRCDKCGKKFKYRSSLFRHKQPKNRRCPAQVSSSSQVDEHDQQRQQSTAPAPVISDFRSTT